MKCSYFWVCNFIHKDRLIFFHTIFLTSWTSLSHYNQFQIHQTSFIVCAFQSLTLTLYFTVIMPGFDWVTTNFSYLRLIMKSLTGSFQLICLKLFSQHFLSPILLMKVTGLKNLCDLKVILFSFKPLSILRTNYLTISLVFWLNYLSNNQRDWRIVYWSFAIFGFNLHFLRVWLRCFYLIRISVIIFKEKSDPKFNLL